MDCEKGFIAARGKGKQDRQQPAVSRQELKQAKASIDDMLPSHRLLTFNLYILRATCRNPVLNPNSASSLSRNGVK